MTKFRYIVVEVEHCRECSASSTEHYGELIVGGPSKRLWYCWNAQRWIKEADLDSFPAWCPLPDKPRKPKEAQP